MSYSHFFSKKFQHFCISLDVNFNESLTNDIVSFEQLGPVFLYCAIILDCVYGKCPTISYTKVSDKMIYGNNVDIDQIPPAGGRSGIWSGSAMFTTPLSIVRNNNTKTKSRPKKYGFKSWNFRIFTVIVSNCSHAFPSLFFFYFSANTPLP